MNRQSLIILRLNHTKTLELLFLFSDIFICIGNCRDCRHFFLRGERGQRERGFVWLSLTVFKKIGAVLLCSVWIFNLFYWPINCSMNVGNNRKKRKEEKLSKGQKKRKNKVFSMDFVIPFLDHMVLAVSCLMATKKTNIKRKNERK